MNIYIKQTILLSEIVNIHGIGVMSLFFITNAGYSVICVVLFTHTEQMYSYVLIG